MHSTILLIMVHPVLDKGSKNLRVGEVLLRVIYMVVVSLREKDVKYKLFLIISVALAVVAVLYSLLGILSVGTTLGLV